MSRPPEDHPIVRTVTFKTPPRAYVSTESLFTKVFGSKNPPNQRVSESLDYEPVQNKIFYDRIKSNKEKRKFYGYTGKTLAKFLITLFTGIFTGIAAVCMSLSVNYLIEWKLEYVQSMLDTKGSRIFVTYMWNCAFSSGLVFIATAMVQYWAPAAAGAGVTLVMAYLNGNHIPNLLRFRTLLTKFVGTVCAVAAGLPMGPEGPMVHIGAACASVITYFECNCFNERGVLSCLRRRNKDGKSWNNEFNDNLQEKLKVLDEIVSDADHREFVSAGTSAGISAAFGAPIGGVLFAMEEACSFWNRKTAWRCFIAAVTATFTLSELSSSAQRGMISFTGLHQMKYKDWLKQMPFILVNSAMAGLLGAAFNSMRMWLWKLRASKTRHCLRIFEVVGLALLCVSCGFFFASTAGQCVKKNPEWDTKGETYGVRWLCEEGYHNDAATLFLSSNHHTITHLFSMGQSAVVPHFTKGSLALYLVFYLILMSIGAGVAIPGGLFMPSILVGATWGSLFGLVVHDWFPKLNVEPGLYALMAAAGVLGGVFRSAISLVILVVEGTRGIEYMFGVILAVVVANWVAHHIHHDGVYESELERIGNIYMLRDEAPHRLHTLTAEMIMGTGVYGFKAIESVARILEVLRSTTHNGFPVLGLDPNDIENAEDGGRLEGLVLRTQLLVLLQHRHFCDMQGRPVGRTGDEAREFEIETAMRTFYRHYFTHNRYVSATAAPLEALDLGAAPDALTPALDLNTVYLDLRPYMNRSPFTVRKDCSAGRVHHAFVSLGLRHLCVVDNYNRVVGIITRKDLDHAAGHGWWRMSHQATPPNNHIMRAIASNPLFRKIPSVGFLKAFMGDFAATPRAAAGRSGVNNHHAGHHHGHHHDDDDGGDHHEIQHARGPATIGLSSSPRRGGLGRHDEDDDDEPADDERTALRFAEDGDSSGFGRH